MIPSQNILISVKIRFDFISNNAAACSFPSNPPEPVIKQYLFVRSNFDFSIIYNYLNVLVWPPSITKVAPVEKDFSELKK